MRNRQRLEGVRYLLQGLLGQLGRWPEALRMYQEVAEARTQALGPDHPDTLAARYEVGISLGRLGRSADALTLYRALVDDRIRVHGAADAETLRARHGLGVNLGRLGRLPTVSMVRTLSGRDRSARRS